MKHWRIIEAGSYGENAIFSCTDTDRGMQAVREFLDGATRKPNDSLGVIVLKSGMRVKVYRGRPMVSVSWLKGTGMVK